MDAIRFHTIEHGFLIYHSATALSALQNPSCQSNFIRLCPLVKNECINQEVQTSTSDAIKQSKIIVIVVTASILVVAITKHLCMLFCFFIHVGTALYIEQGQASKSVS